jgi:hypothetical protein
LDIKNRYLINGIDFIIGWPRLFRREEEAAIITALSWISSDDFAR